MTRSWASAALLPAMLLLIHPSHTSARTWYVKPDSTGDVPTISVAVDSAATEGDTVLLADGIFTGPGNREVDCLDKALTIASESGDPETCIIDCGSPPICGVRLVALYFRESSHGTPRLEGVTIRDGCGGVVCDVGSAPVITNCIFRGHRCYGCEVGSQGAGMVCYSNSEPVIEDCLFVDNGADGGGGLCLKGSWATLTRVTFLNNSASGGGGMLTENGGFARLTDCTFSGNSCGSLFGSRATGGGMCCRASAELVNCVFTENVSGDYAGGGLCFLPDLDNDYISLDGCTFVNNRVEAWGWEGGGGGFAAWSWASGNSITITDCTFSGNGVYDSWYQGGGLAFIGDGTAVLENTLIAFNDSGAAVCCIGAGNVNLVCCNIYGNAGGDWTACIEGQLGISGNISADPLFCDTLGGDYRLETCSPCLPGNHPDGYDCGVPIGAFCSGCPCEGATVPTTWGAIKAMYR